MSFDLLAEDKAFEKFSRIRWITANLLVGKVSVELKGEWKTAIHCTDKRTRQMYELYRCGPTGRQLRFQRHASSLGVPPALH